MSTNRQVSHLTFDLSTRGESRHRVDNDKVNRRGSHQLINNLQRHLTGVGLGDQQVLDINAQRSGINGIQGMLRIHKGRHTTTLLHFSNRVQGERGFTGTFWAVDLHHATLRITTTQREVKGQRTGGNRLHPHAGGIAQPHDRSLAEVALDLTQNQIQRLVPLAGGTGVRSAGFRICRHEKDLKLINERSNATEATNRLK